MDNNTHGAPHDGARGDARKRRVEGPSDFDALLAEAKERGYVEGYESGLMDPGSAWMNARNERAERAEAALADLRERVRALAAYYSDPSVVTPDGVLMDLRALLDDGGAA